MVSVAYNLMDLCKFNSNVFFFSVPSTKMKVNDDNEASKLEVEIQQEEVNSCTEHLNEPQVDHQEESNSINENAKENPTNFKDESNNTEEETNIPETNDESKESEGDVNLLSQIILEKLKFLSEGKSGVSPVQLMSIQLQVNEILFYFILKDQHNVKLINDIY